MELPSVTMKRNKEWNEMEVLYTEAYNSLTTAVTTVGAIVAMRNRLSPEVDLNILTNMVSVLNTNIESLRNELNEIHRRAQLSKNEDMDMLDVNMECIQIASQYNDWGFRFSTLCGQPLADIITYVETKGNYNEQ